MNSRRGIALLAILVSGISIAGYIVLSLAVNTLPPEPDPFSQGWVALIEPPTESHVDQVSLQADADYDYVQLNVYVCGSRPYKADLILDGFKNPIHASFDPLKGAIVPLLPVRVRPFTITYTEEDGVGATIDYGPVRDISVNFPQVLPCSGSVGKQLIPGLAAPPDLSVSANLAEPSVKRTAIFWGLWPGPRASLTFPLIGDIGSAAGAGVSVPFTLNGSPRKWEQPAQENVLVRLVPNLGWSIDSAVPGTSEANTPVWSGHGGIGPIAQFSIPPQLALLQDWIVIFAVGLGIGGGLIASMLFEFLRPQAANIDTQSSAKAISPQRQLSRSMPISPSRHKERIVLIGVIVVVNCILKRKRRQKN